MFAVIDLETTGISASYNHRIIEIGVVQCDADGSVTRTWETLINPMRDVGAHHIHGIGATMLKDAPKFEEIAGTLLELFEGRKIVAHNMNFESQFLRSEFARLGFEHDFGGFCTMRGAISARIGNSLSSCCGFLGFQLDNAHTALADALAAARVLQHLLKLENKVEAIDPFTISSDQYVSAAHLGHNSDKVVVRSDVNTVVEPHPFLTKVVRSIKVDSRVIDGEPNAVDFLCESSRPSSRGSIHL